MGSENLGHETCWDLGVNPACSGIGIGNLGFCRGRFARLSNRKKKSLLTQGVTVPFQRGSDCRHRSAVPACSAHSGVQGKGFVVRILALEP